MRIVWLVHHLLCILCQFPFGPLGAYMSALGMQVEISNIFMNIRTFGKALGFKTVYFVSIDKNCI